MKTKPIRVTLICTLLLSFTNCVELQGVDESRETSGPIKVRISRKYSFGNDYYFFDAFDAEKGDWKRVMSVWRDATGAMPIENVRTLDAQVAYLFLVDQVAITKDGGHSWAVFNTSTFYNCGWEGCANIKDVSMSSAGFGRLTGFRRVGGDSIGFELITGDGGVTWHSS